MASTFTTDLRLELQTNGENSSTWGTKVNATIQQIEDAIAGMVSISTTGGTTALTTANGATDQSRYAMIKFTGVLVSNATIEVPAVSKEYLVWNATSGAYSLTVKVSGGTGVVVTQGATSHVFCDAAEVYDAAVSLASAQTLTNKTLTSPAINGTVTTTGLTLPALTLSGAVAGGGQNVSGLGTLGCGAITSSGLITSTSAGNLFLANTATTTGPYFDILNTAGRMLLGVENSSGGSLLVGSTANAVIINSVANKPVQIGSNNAVVGTFSSTGLAVPGAVSIGTTFPASLSSGYSQQFIGQGGAVVAHNAASSCSITQNAYFHSSGNWYARVTAASSLITQGNLEFNWYSASGTADTALTLGAAKMTLDASGNLIQTVNSTAPTLGTNKTLAFELTSDTQLKIKVRGSDGVTRSVSLTLS